MLGSTFGGGWSRGRNPLFWSRFFIPLLLFPCLFPLFLLLFLFDGRAAAPQTAGRLPPQCSATSLSPVNPEQILHRPFPFSPPSQHHHLPPLSTRGVPPRPARPPLLLFNILHDRVNHCSPVFLFPYSWATTARGPILGTSLVIFHGGLPLVPLKGRFLKVELLGLLLRFDFWSFASLLTRGLMGGEPPCGGLLNFCFWYSFHSSKICSEAIQSSTACWLGFSSVSTFGVSPPF
jgi:hypothetical protein